MKGEGEGYLEFRSEDDSGIVHSIVLPCSIIHVRHLAMRGAVLLHEALVSMSMHYVCHVLIHPNML